MIGGRQENTKEPYHTMFLASGSGRAPGVVGLLQGQSWQDTEKKEPARLSKPQRGPQIESLAPIGRVLNRIGTPNLRSEVPFSPVSTSSTIHNDWSTPTIRPQHTDDHLLPVFSEEKSSHWPLEELIIPDMALRKNGGWFDPNKMMFFNIVYNEFANITTDELFQLYFARTARPGYGENHTWTRGKTTEAGSDLFSDEERPLAVYQSKPKSNHKRQEQLRRVRHRVLQGDTYECTPDCLIELAEREMPVVKDKIREESRRERAQPQTSVDKKRPIPRSVNRAGKDDQLVSAAMIPALSAMLILRQHQALVEKTDDNAYLRRQVAELQSDIRRHSNVSLPQIHPPVPAPSLKRRAAGNDRASFTGSAFDKAADTQPGKKQRPNTEQMHRSPQVGSNLLPPSPTPSCDGCASPF